MAGRTIPDADHDERDEPPRYVRIGNALLAFAEDAIYVGIAALLAVSAGVLLLSAARGLTELGEPGASEVVLEVLDRLLLVFIVVELLFAVRVILGKREVVAEPFLIVGHHRLDQGDHRALGQGRRLRRQGREVQPRHHRGGRPGRARAGARRLGDPAARSRSAQPQEGDEGAVREASKDGEALKVGQGDPEGAAGG